MRSSRYRAGFAPLGSRNDRLRVLYTARGGCGRNRAAAAFINVFVIVQNVDRSGPDREKN